MAQNPTYFGERNAHLFSRVPYFETHSTLREPMQSDLQAIFEGNINHFHVREGEFEGEGHNEHIRQMYGELRERLHGLQQNNNTFREVFARNLHNREITNPIVRSGPLLTRWWGFWRRTEERIDRQPPRVAEAWNHFYQGSDPHARILQLVRNIYTARGHGLGEGGHGHTPTPPPEGGGGQREGGGGAGGQGMPPIVFQPHIEVNPTISPTNESHGGSITNPSRIVRVPGETRLVRLPGTNKVIRVPGDTRVIKVPGQTRVIRVPTSPKRKGGGSNAGTGGRGSSRPSNIFVNVENRANSPSMAAGNGFIEIFSKGRGLNSKPIYLTKQDIRQYLWSWYPKGLNEKQEEWVGIIHKGNGKLTPTQVKGFQALFKKIKLG